MERKSSGVEELIKTVVLIPLRFIDHPSFPIFIRTYMERLGQRGEEVSILFSIEKVYFFPPVRVSPAGNTDTSRRPLYAHECLFSLASE